MAGGGEKYYGQRNYGVGLNNVGSYQVSGQPYLTGASLPAGDEHKIEFPFVTKEVTVVVSGSANDVVRVHFNSQGESNHVIAGHHYVTLDDDDQSVTFNVKCKQLYVSAPGTDTGYECFAVLTNIPTGSMYDLTGSGLTHTETA